MEPLPQPSGKGTSRRFTSATTRAGSTGFARKAAHPTARAIRRSAAPSSPVSAITGMALVSAPAFSVRVAVHPSISGIEMSIRTRSGRASRAIRIAARPSAASSTSNPATRRIVADFLGIPPLTEPELAEVPCHCDHARLVAIALIIGAMAGFAIVALQVKRPFMWFVIIFSATVFPIQMVLMPLFMGYVGVGIGSDSNLGGDLNKNFNTDEGTSSRRVMIGQRFGATLWLATASTVLAVLLGIPLGTLAARHAGRLVDLLVSTVVLFGISMPVYWLGLMLIIVFSIRLRWLPAAGAEGPLSIILPAATLAFFSMAFVARITRSSMLEVLHQDYVRTAVAKGASRRAVVWRHALRNALAPVITVVGLQFGELLGGAILTETVFGWPGLGRLLVDSIFARDYPVVQGLVIVFAFLFALVNLAVDMTYSLIDPRVRYG